MKTAAEIITYLYGLPDVRRNARTITGGHWLMDDLISEVMIVMHSQPEWFLIDLASKGKTRLIGYVTKTMHNQWRGTSSEFNTKHRPKQEQTFDWDIQAAADVPDEAPAKDTAVLIHPKRATDYAVELFRSFELTDQRVQVAAALLIEKHTYEQQTERYHYVVKWAEMYAEMQSYRKVAEAFGYKDNGKPRVSHVTVQQYVQQLHSKVRQHLPAVTHEANDHAAIEICMRLKRAGIYETDKYYIASGEPVPAFSFQELIRVLPKRYFGLVHQDNKYWSDKLLTNAVGGYETRSDLAAEALLFLINIGFETPENINKTLSFEPMKVVHKKRILQTA